MPRPNLGRVSVTFRLDPDDLYWLDREADRVGTDRTDVVRRALEHYRQLPEPQRGG